MSKPEAAPEMMNDGQRSILEWLQSNPPTAEVLEELEGLRQIAGLKLDGNAGFERDPKTGLHGGPFLAGFETLPPEIQEQWKKTQAANEYLYNLALASIGTAFEYRDNGLNVVDESLFTKKLLERTKREKLVIGQNPETGETAILTIIDGYLDPYEKEILEMREKGFTRQEIAERFGMNKEQIKGFIKRYNRSQRKLEAGIALKRKGRPPKDYVVSEQDKVAELKYILARKDAKIKSLEMENELMRDFLSLTERK